MEDAKEPNWSYVLNVRFSLKYYHLRFLNLDFIGVILASEVMPRSASVVGLGSWRLGASTALVNCQGVQESRVALTEFSVIECLQESKYIVNILSTSKYADC